MIRVKDQSGEVGPSKDLFTLDGFGQYDASLPFAAAQPGEGATESMQLYPWLRSQPKSLWEKYPARGMPTSPGETDEWAPLPAQGSAYAGKGVTMPDVPPKWDLGVLGLGPKEEKMVNEVRWQLLMVGTMGVILHPLWVWFLWRALKHEKSLFFKIFAWVNLVGSGFATLASAGALAGGIALSSEERRKALADELSRKPKYYDAGPLFEPGEMSFPSQIAKASNPVSSLISTVSSL